MDEEITIINANTRKEKINTFLINNKKNIIIAATIIFVVVIGYFSFELLKEKNKIKLANKFNSILINFKTEDKQKTINQLIEIINKNDITYSPLALYFLIDNNLIENKDEINILFDELLNETNLEKEIKNLNIYKKGLFNSSFVTENELLQILSPIINSESIWKSHALYLVAEYFYAKGDNQKAKEFFNNILVLPSSNQDIKIASQKRLKRDLGE